jgi:thiamine-phosphate pyrophosphorylase
VNLPRPPLLLITDRHQAAAPLETLVASALADGCRWVSLREKDLSAAERRAVLARLVALGNEAGATVTVHGDVAAAVECAAHGVHLPRGGDVAAARAALGEGALIGVSAHDLAEAETAAGAGADYVTLSPIFDSRSKPGYGPALGLAGLSAVAARLPIPVVALGGIDLENALACLSAGAEAVAVMGAVMRAADSAAAVCGLVEALERS